MTTELAYEEDDEDSEPLVGLGLLAAYADDEPEYSLELIKEPNPDYTGGRGAAEG